MSDSSKRAPALHLVFNSRHGGSCGKADTAVYLRLAYPGKLFIRVPNMKS